MVALGGGFLNIVWLIDRQFLADSRGYGRIKAGCTFRRLIMTMYDGQLQANHCYRVDSNGVPVLEQAKMSRVFFRNPLKWHVAFPHDARLNKPLNPWVLGTAGLPLSRTYEYRLMRWAEGLWFILSLSMDEAYSLTVHVEEGGYELSSTIWEIENPVGKFEFFPFFNERFRTLRPLATPLAQG